MTRTLSPPDVAYVRWDAFIQLLEEFPGRLPEQSSVVEGGVGGVRQKLRGTMPGPLPCASAASNCGKRARLMLVEAESYIVPLSAAGRLAPGNTRVWGESLEEPAAWDRPIVINTQEQRAQAFNELERGTFLKSGATRGKPLPD
jgi:hypothetical protein